MHSDRGTTEERPDPGAWAARPSAVPSTDVCGAASAPDDLAIALTHAFGQFGPRFVNWMKAGIRDDGVSLGRLRLLRSLDQDGPQIMASLRRNLHVTARNITQLVEGLEADGLVARRPHPHDRRASLVSLTSEGRARARALFRAHIARTATLFAQLDVADQEHLLKTLTRLTAQLESLPSDE